MASRLNLSIAYMVKNEGEYLKASLESVAPYCSELLVFDTGSEDQTASIAKNFKGKVPSFRLEELSWKDDFSWARNQIASAASNEWLLFVDGDEVLDRSGWQLIEKILKSPTADSYSFIQRNYTADLSHEGAIRFEGDLPGLKKSKQLLAYFDNWMERLYRPQSGLQYEGRIHESLLPASRRLGLKHERLEVILHHYGRLKVNAPLKAGYYLKLQEAKCREEPNNPIAFVEWLTNLLELELFERAFELARTCVQKFPNETEVWKLAFQAALRANEFTVAEQWIQEFLKRSSELQFGKSQLSTALLYQRRLDETLKTTAEVFKLDPKDFVAHVNSAVVHFENKNWPQALTHIETALSQKPEDQFLLEARAKVLKEIQR